jgi:hypothetical protein
MRKLIPLRYFTSAIALILAGTAWTSRATKTSSPNLDKATGELQTAHREITGSDSADPNDPTATSAPLSSEQITEIDGHLQAAVKWLNRATNNKGGEKGDVLPMVKDAMDKLKSGDKATAAKDVQQALDGIFAASHHRGGWQQ